MNIVIADAGGLGYREPVQFAAYHCVGGAATVVGYVSRQEVEAHRSGKGCRRFEDSHLPGGDPPGTQVLLAFCWIKV